MRMHTYAHQVPGGPCAGLRGRLPAPPFNPTDYWATRKWVSGIASRIRLDIDALVGRLESAESSLSGHMSDTAHHVSAEDRARWDSSAQPLAGTGFSGSSLMTNYGLMKAVGDIIEKLGGTIR